MVNDVLQKEKNDEQYIYEIPITMADMSFHVH